MIWRKRPQPFPSFDKLLQEAQRIMASLTDVQTALTGLASDFNTLVAGAKAAYLALQSSVGATPAELDGVLSTVNADRATVQGALATITTATA